MANLKGQTIGNWYLESRVNDMFGSFQARHVETQQQARICVQSKNWLRWECFEKRIEPYMADGTIFSVESYKRDNQWVLLQLPWIEQATVQETIQERGAFSLDETLAILAKVASALDAGHESGLVHGDLKPYSILVDGRLMDWGLQYCLNHCSEPRVEAALPKSFFSYLSVEQIKGEKLNPLMERYTLAAIAFEMLTGQAVYHSTDVVGFIVDYIKGNKVVPVTSISQENLALPSLLDVVFERGLARNPDERFESAMAFVEAMATCI